MAQIDVRENLCLQDTELQQMVQHIVQACSPLYRTSLAAQADVVETCNGEIVALVAAA